MDISPCRKKAIYLIFFLSGFCALLYEILWSKHLSLVFGTAIPAVSIVTATFMGGLALGSRLLGNRADRRGDCLRTYALLEAGIALCALLFVPALGLVESLYVAAARHWPESPLVAHSIQLLLTSFLLLVPAALMGGTFPVICRLFARNRCGGQIGRLYALNTAGATLGAFSAGFLLIPAVGLSRTAYLAVALNLLIALAAWRISRIDPGPTESVEAAPKRVPLLPLQRTVLVSIGLVGLFSLAYEILWTRVLLLFLGNTSYAFALMLSAYLVGISLGGALYARLARPDMNEGRLFVLFCSLMGLSILGTAPFYDQLAHLFQSIHQLSGESWWLLSLLSFAAVVAVMLLPTLFSGALLPAAVALLNPGRRHTGGSVGRVVLYNTLGGVAGSLAAGFFLIPTVGLLESFRLLAICNTLLAIALALYIRKQVRVGKLPATLAFASLLLALIPFSWDPALMNCGVYCYAPKYAAMGGIEQTLAKERIIEVIEGRDTTVAVHESLDGEFRFFTVNGKTDGGTGRDMATQTLVGQLPLLLHRRPQKVLVIGLGTGITLRGLHELAGSIDCVEISPEVVEASAYFDEYSGRPLKQEGVKLIVNDGRNHLLTRSRGYDVIISEPSNPWQSGNANLFTADFYRLANRRLNEGGIFCQWIGLYDITPENLKIACNTFLQSFEQVLAFRCGSDLILVGGNGELAFDYGHLTERLRRPETGRALREIDIASAGDLFARHYLYGSDSLRSFCRGAGLNSDDRPVLEYSARHNLGKKILGEFQMANVRSLMAARSKSMLPLQNLGSTNAEIAAALLDLGEGFARSGQRQEAAHFMRKAAQLLPPQSTN